MTSTVSAASPNGRRKTPSTTRTARTRETGTVASLRWTSPRRMRSRSPSRISVKPPKATTAPAVESSQASTSSAAAPSTTRRDRVRQPAHRLLALLGVEELLEHLEGARQHRHDDPELAGRQRGDRQLARAEAPRREVRRVLRATAAPGRAARSSATAAGVSAGSEISPPFAPAPVWTSTA